MLVITMLNVFTLELEDNCMLYFYYMVTLLFFHEVGITRMQVPHEIQHRGPRRELYQTRGTRGLPHPPRGTGGLPPGGHWTPNWTKHSTAGAPTSTHRASELLRVIHPSIHLRVLVQQAHSPALLPLPAVLRLTSAGITLQG